MPSAVVSRTVNAPAGAIWDVVTNLANSPAVLTQVASVEVLSQGDFGVGTRWRETRTMFGNEAAVEMEVAAVDPGRWYDVVAEDRSATYRSRIELSERDSATVVTMTFSAEGRGKAGRLLGALTGPLTRGATEKLLSQDLADIAAAAEGLTR
jgi:uncharacterized membrane protein